MISNKLFTLPIISSSTFFLKSDISLQIIFDQNYHRNSLIHHPAHGETNLSCKWWRGHYYWVVPDKMIADYCCSDFDTASAFAVPPLWQSSFSVFFGETLKNSALQNKHLVRYANSSVGANTVNSILGIEGGWGGVWVCKLSLVTIWQLHSHNVGSKLQLGMRMQSYSCCYWFCLFDTMLQISLESAKLPKQQKLFSTPVQAQVNNPQRKYTSEIYHTFAIVFPPIREHQPQNIIKVLTIENLVNKSRSASWWPLSVCWIYHPVKILQGEQIRLPFLRDSISFLIGC